MNQFKRGLEGLTEPKLESDSTKSNLHEFMIRAFTWESHPEEAEALAAVEERVAEFIEDYLAPAELIIAKFNSDSSLGQSESERLLLNLQSCIVSVEEEVSRRYIKAQFSYYIWDDEYWKAYREPVGGTQNDLTAYARSKTSDTRYFYFVNYAAWRMINDKVQSLKTTQKQIQQRVYQQRY